MNNPTNTTGSTTPMKTQYEVETTSNEYGNETFGPYDTLTEAYKGIARIAAESAKLNDGVIRAFHVYEKE